MSNKKTKSQSPAEPQLMSFYTIRRLSPYESEAIEVVLDTSTTPPSVVEGPVRIFKKPDWHPIITGKLATPLISCNQAFRPLLNV